MASEEDKTKAQTSLHQQLRPPPCIDANEHTETEQRLEDANARIAELRDELAASKTQHEATCAELDHTLIRLHESQTYYRTCLTKLGVKESVLAMTGMELNQLRAEYKRLETKLKAAERRIKKMDENRNLEFDRLHSKKTTVATIDEDHTAREAGEYHNSSSRSSIPTKEHGAQEVVEDWILVGTAST